MDFLLLGHNLACLQPESHALRPVRIVDNIAVHYTAMSLDPSRSGEQVPSAWCEAVLCECLAIGGVPSAPEGPDAVSDPHDVWIDVLDAQGDILHEVLATESSFAYLIRLLRSAPEA